MKGNQKYVIGVDGGGAKTVAALADLGGRILSVVKTGSASPRNVGLEVAMANVALAIRKVLGKRKNIVSTFLGLPCLEEEFKNKKELIKKELLKHKKISSIFKGKIIIGSDQLVGFRSGTNKKDGVVLIAGSGCVARGWRGEKEVKVCGWGYLSEMGSGFWVGQKALQAIWKELDGRGPKTLITKLVFQKPRRAKRGEAGFAELRSSHALRSARADEAKPQRPFKIKNKENLIEKIYSKNPTEIIPSLAILVNKADKKGDKIAKKILIEAGRELALSANTIIKKLKFQKNEFPLVLIGSLFESKRVLDTVKKEIKKIASEAVFIRPEVEPAIGAVKLALEQVKKNEKTKTLL